MGGAMLLRSIQRAIDDQAAMERLRAVIVDTAHMQGIATTEVIARLEKSLLTPVTKPLRTKGPRDA